MKQLARVAVLVAVGVWGAGCPKRVAEAGESVLRPADYYPLAVGNRWTYEASFLGEKREAVVEILKEEAGFFHDSQGGQLAVDAYGVRDQKRYLLREPLEAGRGWTNVVSVSSVEHYRVLEAFSGCQAPAGRFTGCIRVEGRNRVDEKTTLINELTFAPAVGLVKIEVFAESDGKRIPQTQLLLRSFEPAEVRTPTKPAGH